jgi:hypothetical protein
MKILRKIFKKIIFWDLFVVSKHGSDVPRDSHSVREFTQKLPR